MSKSNQTPNNADELRTGAQKQTVEQTGLQSSVWTTRFVLACATIIAAVSIIASSGWVTGVHVFANVQAGHVPMAPSTAVSFLALSAALLVCVRQSISKGLRYGAQGATLFVAALCAMVLLRTTGAVHLSIEQILHLVPKNVGAGMGRMSPITAVALIIAAFAVFVSLSVKREKLKGSAVFLAVALAISGLTIVMGYIYGNPLLYGGPLIPVALMTGIGIFFIGIGLIAAAGPTCWPLRLMIGDSLDARLRRMFLPLLFIVIILDNIINAHTNALTSSDISIAVVDSFLAIITFVVFSIVVSKATSAINISLERADADRRLVENTQLFLLRSGWSSSDEDFFALLARYLAETLDMDFVCIDRLTGDCLEAQTVAVYFDGKFEDNITYTLAETPCYDVVGKNICAFPRDVRHLFPKDDVLQEMMAEGYIGTTLWSSDGQIIGLIAMISRKPLTNLETAESILKLAAIRASSELERRQAEAALLESNERLEALSGQLLSAQESERRNIARELHDEIGAILTALSINLELASRPSTELGMLGHINEAKVMTSDIMMRVQKISTNLRSTMLDDLGLVPALVHYFDDYLSKTGVRVSFKQVDCNRRFATNLETCAFRVIQEALTNIAKHSGVTKAKVVINADNRQMKLLIVDEGCGFNTKAVRHNKSSYGLIGMQERVTIHNGLFDIKSTAGKGTQITVTLPLQDSEDSND